LKTWLNEVANYTDGDVNKLILANKEDEVSERKVSKEAIDEFMKTTGVEVKEVSAKSGKGVEEAFKYMVQKLITQK
jgi:putative ribosome biogenesis GTPase RsgA